MIWKTSGTPITLPCWVNEVLVFKLMWLFQRDSSFLFKKHVYNALKNFFSTLFFVHASSLTPSGLVLSLMTLFVLSLFVHTGDSRLFYS